MYEGFIFLVVYIDTLPALIYKDIEPGMYESTIKIKVSGFGICSVTWECGIAFGMYINNENVIDANTIIL